MLVVNERGDVMVCTTGMAEQFKLGNLFDHKLSELASGKKMEEYRLAHIMQDFTDIPMCAECPDRLIYKNYEPEFFIAYLKDINREDLIPKVMELFYGKETP
jgi:radical SAM protein with 4Fe4S-binding SPASM domain